MLAEPQEGLGVLLFLKLYLHLERFLWFLTQLGHLVLLKECWITKAGPQQRLGRHPDKQGLGQSLAQGSGPLAFSKFLE